MNNRTSHASPPRLSRARTAADGGRRGEDPAAEPLPAIALPPGRLPAEAALSRGRMHEATGPGRRVFAAAVAGRLDGPVLWLVEAREREMLCPQGLAAHLDPARLILVRPPGRLAVLQAMEEALRSGAAAVVVAELDRAADLTQSRRLQLAAGAGSGLGLCLVPETALATNAAESRWHAAPLASPGGPARQLWVRIKSRHGRPGAWEVAPLPHPCPAGQAAPARMPGARSGLG